MRSAVSSSTRDRGAVMPGVVDEGAERAQLVGGLEEPQHVVFVTDVGPHAGGVHAEVEALADDGGRRHAVGPEGQADVEAVRRQRPRRRRADAPTPARDDRDGHGRLSTWWRPRCTALTVEAEGRRTAVPSSCRVAGLDVGHVAEAKWRERAVAARIGGLEDDAQVVATGVEALDDGADEAVRAGDEQRNAARSGLPGGVDELVDLVAGLAPEQPGQVVLVGAQEVHREVRGPRASRVVRLAVDSHTA